MDNLIICCYLFRLKPDKQLRKESEMKEVKQGITLIAPPGLFIYCYCRYAPSLIPSYQYYIKQG